MLSADWVVASYPRCQAVEGLAILSQPPDLRLRPLVALTPGTPMSTRHSTTCVFSAVVLLSTSAQLLGQALPPAPPASSNATAEPAVEMSPFNVNTDKDVGYHAENTLAGSRLNARLKDTAGSVAVFTKEFMDDLMITDLNHLLEYTVNLEPDTNAWQAGDGQNPMITGENLLNRTINRGLAASQGMDYFTNITNPDPYRAGRFEDARGPNSILFGVGAPGGLLNQSSKVAVTHRNSANLRYGFGSWDRSRAEFDVNRVLIKNKLAVSIAALDQENGGWRQFDFQDKERIFAAVTAKPHRTLSIQAMGELGKDESAVLKTQPPGDEFLAWYDHRQARGVAAVTVTPVNAAPTAAMIAMGITGRNGNFGGQARRATLIENTGQVFDAIGMYVTGSYNNVAVRHPDGTSGGASSRLSINDTSIYPRWGNASGPGMRRMQSLHNYTITADWQPTRNLSVNLATHYQSSVDPVIRGEPNRTLGLNGPANPFAGQLYVDGNWRGDIHHGDYRESRISASYTIDTKRKWLGRHRVAASGSVARQSDLHALSWLSLVGAPFNAQPSNANNRVAVRNYFTDGDIGTYRGGDWRSLGKQMNFGGRTFDLAFVNDDAGANNSGMQQDTDSVLGVLQSYFGKDRLVTTVGYRLDKVEITQFGYAKDAVLGDVVDADRSKATITNLTAKTLSVGGVYHVTSWFSLIANKSSNVGVPPLARTIFPDGNLAPLSKGKGKDYGIGLDLLDGRVSARFVYFTASEQGRITSAGLGGAPGRNSRVAQAFASVLVGTGRPISQAQWEPTLRSLTPPANAIASDFTSEGYEARITTNLTKNWRLVLNYSYTDSGRTNLANEMADWYGLKPADGVLLVQGARQDASGRYVVDASAFNDGAIKKWLELGAMSPNANPSTLVTGTDNVTVAEEIYDLTEALNDEKLLQEKRWGVRPHKLSFFTAYDFKENVLKGFTIGGGWRWRSANVIGSDANGSEITGRVIQAADAMLAYSTKIKRLPGRLRFQVNVANLFDETNIIPVRLATSATAPNGYTVPGGRGLAYSRYDLVTPREWRFTTTYSF
jgi:iron complex outermembrane recepter protein